MNRDLHVAVFDDERRFLEAAAACGTNSLEIVEAYSPYPIHELDAMIGHRKTRLPYVTLIGGLLGLGIGLWFQYWASGTDWPLNVGGKPWDSFPAFVPVAFEMTVLFAGFATVIGLLVGSRLRPGAKPRRRIERVTDDRFALVIRRKSTSLSWPRTEEFVSHHAAVEHWVEQA